MKMRLKKLYALKERGIVTEIVMVSIGRKLNVKKLCVMVLARGCDRAIFG